MKAVVRFVFQKYLFIASLVSFFLSVSLYFYIDFILIKNLNFASEKIESLEEKASNIDLEVIRVENSLQDYSLEMQSHLHAVNNKISVLDESIDPQDKRWARIKNVRSVVIETIEKNGYKRHLDIKGLTSYASAVVDYSEQYDVPISLILAITRRESAFNPSVVSHAGAQGLMQLMPMTAKECADDLGKRHYSSFNIRDNVQMGVWYLSKMIYSFKGDVELSIRAYNCGPTYVRRVLAGEIKNYPEETRKYHEIVMKWKNEYEAVNF